MRSVAGKPTLFAVASIVAFLLTGSFAQDFADVLSGALAYAPAFILLLALVQDQAASWEMAS